MFTSCIEKDDDKTIDFLDGQFIKYEFMARIYEVFAVGFRCDSYQ